MTPARRFDLIVFDWDGTLYDSTALITRCIQAACADVGVAVPSDRDASYVIGMGLAEALQHAAPDLPRERYPELGLRYRHHYHARQHEIAFFEGTLTMLNALKARGHLLAVATGKSRSGLDAALGQRVRGALRQRGCGIGRGGVKHGAQAKRSGVVSRHLDHAWACSQPCRSAIECATCSGAKAWNSLGSCAP